LKVNKPFPTILGAFARLRKATVNFARVSVRGFGRMEQLESHWRDYYEILYFSVFRKSFEKFQVH